MAEKIELPWGEDERIELELPEGWRVKTTLSPNRPANPPPFEEVFTKAMDRPVGMPPLAEFAAGASFPARD